VTATADSLNALGNDLKEEGRLAEAEQTYLRAAELDPAWSVPWFNAGLVCKIQRRWADAARYNRRALTLDPGDSGAWWNLGIAATALGDWVLAREAWRGCGIAVPDGDGPPEMPYGPVPIRLNPDADAGAEVIWCTRIDPARAIIRNVPLPASGHAEGDTVLHDGAPNGYRVLNGRQLAVFDALQVLERSGRLTIEAWIEAASADDVEALVDAGDGGGITVEDWTRTLRHLCKQCSEGVPHEEHDSLPAEWDPRRHLGIAADSERDVLRLLEAWSRGGPDRRVLGVGRSAQA